MLKYAFALLTVMCFLACVQPAARAAPFSFAADGEPLPDLLCTFSAAQGRNCLVSPQITGSISGNLNFATVQAFNAFMEQSKGVVSYVDATTMYFYDRTELQSELLPLKNITVSGIIAALREMDAYDARYPLRPLNGGKMFRVSAPPAYMDLIVQLAADLEGSYTARKATRVFRLQHAWAEDVTLDFLGASTTVPGVATLLRDLTGEGTVAPSPIVSAGASRQPGGLRGQGLARLSASQDTAQPSTPPGQTEKASPGRIMADARLNAIIIWDDEELMPLYETLIAELDVAVPLVEIRTAIVDVSVSRVEELGVSWNVNAPGSGHWGVIGGANVGESTDVFTSATGLGLNATTIFRSGLDEFMARIHALEEDGDAAVLSRPAVLTLDNIQATIESTTTFYIQVAGQEEVDLFDVTYGTVLRVTPHVLEDPDTGRKLIKMVVYVEDGGSQAAPTGSGVTYPTISRTTVNTQALVADGDLLIIGGYYYETDVSLDSGIPGLKHLPVLGRLFGTDSRNYRKQERLFLIAPRTIEPTHIAAQQEQYAPLFQRRIENSVPFTRTTGGGCGQARTITIIQDPPPPVDAAVESAPPKPLEGRPPEPRAAAAAPVQ